MKKYINLLLPLLAFALSALPSAHAAITHDETVYGFDSEAIAGASSYYWEAALFIQDDDIGFIVITWYTDQGTKYAFYGVDANAVNWTLVGGDDASGSAAESYLDWYL